MTSEIRANTLKNRVGLGTVSFTNTGPVVSGIVTANTIRLADDNKIQLGDDQDLEILHDPSNGIIRSINSGGNMHVESKNHIELNVNYNPSTGSKENALKAIANNGVSLYFNNAPKFSTTNTGATVTGTLVATTFDGNVTGNISGGTVAGSTGTFSGDVSITDKIVHTDDTNTAIRFPADDQISFETGGTNRLKIHTYSSNNHVELDASTHLSLADNGSNGRFIYMGDANASSTGYMHLQPGAGSQGFGGGIRIYSHANSTNAGGVYIGKSLNSSGAIIFGNGGMTPSTEYLRITDAASSFTNKLIIDDGSNGHLFLNNTSSENTIHSGTTGFGAYKNLVINAAQHIFKVSNTERARITSGGEFQIQHFSPPDGSSANRAARSALEIKRHYPQKTSGNYWIIDNNGTARQIYCEMETDGGGWMLWHDHNAPGSKVSMNIALGGSDASPSGNLARGNYNNYAYYSVWIKASQIDATGERLHSFVTLDGDGEIKYIADYGSDFLLENVGDQYQPNRNDYFASNTTGEYVSNTQMYAPQCGATGWENFSNGGWSEVYIREMDTRISPGDHRSLHLVDRIYNFDSNGVPFWIVAESMHPTPHWSDFSLIQGEAADGNNPNIQTHNVEINSMNGNNGPSVRARARGVLTGTFEYTFQLGYNWGWSIACLNATIGIENAIKDQSSDPYSAYTQPYYHASLYNNSSNNLWYPTSRAAWQSSDVSQSYSPGINYGNHVLWRESDGTIKARDKSGTHSNYTFPTKFAGPLIMCSGSQSPHYTKLQSVWNTGNTYDSVSAFHGRNRWYK